MSFYHYVGSQHGNLQVLIQTHTPGHSTEVWKHSTQPQMGTWQRTVITFSSNHSFQVCNIHSLLVLYCCLALWSTAVLNWQCVADITLASYEVKWDLLHLFHKTPNRFCQCPINCCIAFGSKDTPPLCAPISYSGSMAVNIPEFQLHRTTASHMF